MKKTFIANYTVLLPTLLCSSLTTQTYADDAYAFELVYTGEYWSNLEGGIQEDEVYLDNLDLVLEVDAEQAFGLSGGTLFTYVLYNNSNTLSEPIVGDAQTVSNIDNTTVVRLMEFWYEQTFANDQALKFGLYDLNSEFDAVETAGLFINSSHGIAPEFSQSGENGPSIFPVSSLSLRYFHPVSDTVSYQLAVLDAVPGDPDDPHKNTIDLSSEEGVLLAAETNINTDNTRLSFGGWYYNKETETNDGASSKKNRGVYAIFEHTLLTADTNGEDLSYWFRYGHAEKTVNQFDYYFGSGVVYGGFLSSRPDDVVGFAIAYVHNGSDYRQAIGIASDSNEVNYEFTYRAQITERFALQPDIQYITNTGTDPLLDDALVVGLRCEFVLF